jgi:hypothetical protein
LNPCLALAASLLFGAATAARAADASAEPPVDSAQRPWALQVTSYLWVTGMEGSISPFRAAPTIEVDKSFSDVLDDFNFGGFVNVWGRYEQFVFSGDLMYVDTTDSKAFGPLPPVSNAIPAGTVVEGSVNSKEFMTTLQGGYRVYDTPDFTVDALGGVRFWHISTDVTVSALGLSRSYGESFGWADPVVGARAFLRLTEKVSIQAQADVGGFGAGSDLTWSALATANYIVNDNVSLSAGYKVLEVDYDRDGHVFDTRFSGPVLGMTYRF